MTPRDSRGRFVTEREHAATFLLEVALADARKRIAEFTDLEPVITRLAEATRCADLLLAGEAS